MRVLILGCGYVGLALARRLVASGHEVFGLRRNWDGVDERRSRGIQPLTGDLTDPSDLRALPGPFDWVANTVSSTKGAADVYRRVYFEGTRQVLAWLVENPCRRYVYTSSTSVYGQTDGSEVTETSPTEPVPETARILVETEQLLLAKASALEFRVGIFRAAGIYGPERGHLYQQYLRGEARVSGDGSRLINMIHREDLASALATYLEGSELPAGVRFYNAVDNEAVTQLEFFRWLSRRLSRPMPPFATAMENASRKRGFTQKRVCNQRLRTELRWVPKYPTFREGYEELFGELPSAGGSLRC